MADFDLEQFVHISRSLQEFFNFRVSEPLRELVLWGPGTITVAIDEWSPHLHAALPNNPEPVEFRAWKDQPQRTMVAPTAHECAATMLHAIWTMVFPEQTVIQGKAGNPAAFWKAADAYLSENEAETTKRWRFVQETADNPEWMRIASRMKIELAHVERKYRLNQSPAGKSDKPLKTASKETLVRGVLLKSHFDNDGNLIRTSPLTWDRIVTIVKNGAAAPRRGWSKTRGSDVFKRIFTTAGAEEYRHLLEHDRGKLWRVLNKS